MKTIPIILACIGSGFAGAASLNLLTPSPAQADGNQTEVIAALRGEIAAFQDQSRADREALEDRLARMEEDQQLVAPSFERSFVPDRVNENISDGNLPLATSSTAIQIGNTTIQPEQFEAWVRAASASIDAQKQADRDQERLIREGERTEERIAKLTTDLGLDQHQQSEFRRHLTDSGTARRDLFAAMREGGGDRTAIRESMNTLRDANDKDLRTFLSEEQFTTYKDSGADRGGGGRNRGGGGNGGAGDNSGGGGGRRGN